MKFNDPSPVRRDMQSILSTEVEIIPRRRRAHYKRVIAESDSSTGRLQRTKRLQRGRLMRKERIGFFKSFKENYDSFPFD